MNYEKFKKTLEAYVSRLEEEEIKALQCIIVDEKNKRFRERRKAEAKERKRAWIEEMKRSIGRTVYARFRWPKYHIDFNDEGVIMNVGRKYVHVDMKGYTFKLTKNQFQFSPMNKAEVGLAEVFNV